MRPHKYWPRPTSQPRPTYIRTYRKDKKGTRARTRTRTRNAEKTEKRLDGWTDAVLARVPGVQPVKNGVGRGGTVGRIVHENPVRKV